MKLTWYVVYTSSCNFSLFRITKSPVLEFICTVFLSVCYCNSFLSFFLCNLITSLFKVLSACKYIVVVYGNPRRTLSPPQRFDQYRRYWISAARSVCRLEMRKKCARTDFGYVHTISDGFWCHERLSGMAWTLPYSHHAPWSLFWGGTAGYFSQRAMGFS